MNLSDDHTVLYINSQETWWGNYYPNKPKGDDVYGLGTYERPFKTIERALEEFKTKGIKFGSVRDGSQLMAIWPTNYEN